jgi:hypothetical protein
MLRLIYSYPSQNVIIDIKPMRFPRLSRMTCASHIVKVIKNDNPIITQIAPVILATLIHPREIILNITKPGRIRIKKEFGVNLLGFSYKWFSIRKNGTNAIRRISPEHHPDHANPERIPPVTESPERVYLFI